MTREFQERAKYIFGGELDDRLKDPGYRQRLMHFADPLSHPESGMLDFWDQAGSVVKSGLVSETGFMESGAPQSCVQAWQKLAPVVAIMRRTRGDELYANFEWLAARTTLRRERQRFGYPKDTPRMATRDPFPEDLKSAGTS